jgi:hypothetical protein
LRCKYCGSSTSEHEHRCHHCGRWLQGSQPVFPIGNSAAVPALAPDGYVYSGRLYGDFAPDLPRAILYLARPDHLAARLLTPENGLYLAGLFVPVAFLPVLAPGTLLLAVQLPLNMISSWPYAREIQYHYVAPVVPFVFLALVRALEKAGRHRRAALAALVAGRVGRDRRGHRPVPACRGQLPADARVHRGARRGGQRVRDHYARPAHRPRRRRPPGGVAPGRRRRHVLRADPG